MKSLLALCLLLVVGCQSTSLSGSSSSSSSAPDAKTQAAYANFKNLSGDWRGKSTKGWVEELHTETIADGTCVMEMSRFAHGVVNGEGTAMATAYTMDGPRLMLTHYCMAHNQPRLIARKISDDGKDITFEFLDGTNMASRNVGHMDRVIFHFQDQDHYTSQWSFYAKGKEQFMEEISYERTK